jgi:hypothetical protein
LWVAPSIPSGTLSLAKNVKNKFET